MATRARQRFIRECLDQKGYVRLIDLTAAFEVTEQEAYAEVKTYADRHLTELVYDMSNARYLRLDAVEGRC